MAATARGQVTPIMDKLIFKGVRALLGGKVRMILAGGAPLSPESHDFLRTCMGCPLMQVSNTWIFIKEGLKNCVLESASMNSHWSIGPSCLILHLNLNIILLHSTLKAIV